MPGSVEHVDEAAVLEEETILDPSPNLEKALCKVAIDEEAREKEHGGDSA